MKYYYIIYILPVGGFKILNITTDYYNALRLERKQAINCEYTVNIKRISEYDLIRFSNFF